MMTKKLLLVNPRHPQRLVKLNIPLGLLYVGTAASRQGYQVNIIDANNYSSMRRFLERLEQEMDGTLAVGLSVMTAQIARAIGSLRCRNLVFGWPVERGLMKVMRRLGFERLLSAGKFE